MIADILEKSIGKILREFWRIVAIIYNKYIQVQHKI
jgi:hypothetical protein